MGTPLIFRRPHGSPAAHFAAKKAIIDEVSIGTGPAGELRYPSYSSHDSGSGWPNRGFFQAYSSSARADFRAWVMAKYGNLAGLNQTWSTSLKSADEIGPPDDGTAADGRASTFVQLDGFFLVPHGSDAAAKVIASQIGSYCLEVSQKGIRVLWTEIGQQGPIVCAKLHISILNQIFNYFP